MPAIIPFIPAIIGAGGSIASSLINRGGSSSGGSSGSGGPLLPPGLDQNALLKAITGQQETGTKISNEGYDTFGKGSEALGGPLAFYKSLLGGDRNSMMETLAPEISAINAQFAEPLKEAQLLGRGGALATDLDASKQSAISNLFFQARPAAADKLSGIANALMNLGTQQQVSGADIYGRGTGQILDYNSIIRGLQAQGSRDSSQMWGSLGAQLGPLLGQVLGGVFNKGGGTNSSLPIPSIPNFDVPGPPNPYGG